MTRPEKIAVPHSGGPTALNYAILCEIRRDIAALDRKWDHKIGNILRTEVVTLRSDMVAVLHSIAERLVAGPAGVKITHRILYSRREAVQQLSIAVSTIDSLITQGRIRAQRMGRRTLITHAELEKFSRRDFTRLKSLWPPRIKK